MQIKEVHTPLWIERLAELDEQIPLEWVCDRFALRRSGRETAPRREAIKLYLRRKQTTVVVATEGNTLLGYLIGDDDRETKPELGGRGGCRGRWMTIIPNDEHTPTELMQAMFDFLADEYGWIWGRITNPMIRDAIATFGAQQAPDDIAVYTYRKP